MKNKELQIFLKKVSFYTLTVVMAGTLTGCSLLFKDNNKTEQTTEESVTGKDFVSALINDVDDSTGISEVGKTLYDLHETDEFKLLHDGSTIEEIENQVEDAGNDIGERIGMEFQSATLVRVKDGDTIVVNINGNETTVRLIGIDTPESVASQEYLDRTGKENTKEGFTASKYTKTLLENVETVYLEKDVSETDRYGRALRYVWLEVPDTINKDTIAEYMVNGILLSDKIASPVEYEPDTKYAEEFEDIYEEYTY